MFCFVVVWQFVSAVVVVGRWSFVVRRCRWSLVVAVVVGRCYRSSSPSLQFVVGGVVVVVVVGVAVVVENDLFRCWTFLMASSVLLLLGSGHCLRARHRMSMWL